MGLPRNLAFDEVIDEEWTDAVVDTVTPTPWVTVVAFQNGWSSLDAPRQVQYRKIGDRVYLRGLLKPGASGTVAFVMPVGFRPFQVDETFSTVSNASSAGNVSFASGGNVSVTAPGGATFVYLSGMQYSTVA